MVPLLVLVSFVIPTVLAIECNDVGDGIHEVGCKTYVTCINGVDTVTECDQGMVFNSEINDCDLESNVGPPCGLWRDCSSQADGRYPDYETNCTSYYTCQNNVFYGHNYCPGDLVWDVDLNLCNFERDTCPPCGTKVSTSCQNTLLVG